MERETIERLAIDSAAGELNEDAEMLLSVYLAEHSEANKWAKDMIQTYERTQATIDAGIKDVIARDETPVLRMKFIPRMKWLPLGRWAAVILMVFMIGGLLGRWSKEPDMAQSPENAKLSHKLNVKWPTYALRDNGESFWQAKMIASLKPRSYPEGRPHTRDGTLWGKYKQYIKEQRYE